MIAGSLVPGHDHFGVIVAVAPEGVGVEVAFEPGLGLERGKCTTEQAEKDEVVFHWFGVWWGKIQSEQLQNRIECKTRHREFLERGFSL